MEVQLRQRRLQWLGRVQRMSDNRLQKQVLRCRPQGKQGRPGRTQLRWIDVLNRDLAELPTGQDVVKDQAECSKGLKLIGMSCFWSL